LVWLSAFAGCSTPARPPEADQPPAAAPREEKAAVAAVAPLPSVPTGPSRDLEAACAAFAKAYCDKVRACAPTRFATQYGDASRCASREQRECLIFLAPPGSDATAEKIASCAKSTTASCERALAQALECGVKGTRPVGASCAVPAQCTSGRCSRKREQRCGKCEEAPPRKVAGEGCLLDEDCAPGLICGDHAGSKCGPPAALGAACRDDRPCQHPLYCVHGRCVRPARRGERCEFLGGEAPDCAAGDGITCGETKRCESIKVVKLDQACGGARECAAGTFCDGRTCQPEALTDGAPCDHDAGPYCLSPARCIEGRCQTLDPSICR
jgi:hypothetical protein